jgi:hypothetical protein
MTTASDPGSVDCAKRLNKEKSDIAENVFFATAHTQNQRFYYPESPRFSTKSDQQNDVQMEPSQGPAF